MSTDISSAANTEFEKKLVQDKYNVNVAFYVHIKQFDNNVRDEIKKRIEDVFYFVKGIDWKFDSFGVEKAGSRGTDILCYFILRDADVQKLQKMFAGHLKDYENIVKITCSVAKYEKTEEVYFELDI
mgnify:CR=1 FL=1